MLTFHNGRAAISLLLLALNSFDLARIFLPHQNVRNLNRLFQSSPRDLNYLVVIGSGELWNALFSTLLTLMLMLYHRMVERKKATGEFLANREVPSSSFMPISVFLYASTAVEALTFALLSNELFELVRYEDFLELQTCLVAMSAMCMVSLAMLDGLTVYKEVSIY